MEKNFCFVFQYDGSAYYGLQIQKKDSENRFPTIQAEIEKALKRLFCKDVGITYSGRTDRGVHAKNQVANFKVDTAISSPNIKKALNSFVPSDINIRSLKQVSSSFHARFSAKSKLYRYYILNSKGYDVFLRNYTWWLDKKLDISFMKKCSSLLEGEKDFSSFALQAGKYKSCVRQVKQIHIVKRNRFIVIDIEATGFLRGMVRNMVGFLVSAGEHKIAFSDITRGKAVKVKRTMFRPAPACGLYLWRVYY